MGVVRYRCGHEGETVSKGERKWKFFRQGKNVEDPAWSSATASQLEVNPVTREDEGGVVGTTILLIGGLHHHTRVASHFLHLLPAPFTLSPLVTHDTPPWILVAGPASQHKCHNTQQIGSSNLQI